MPSSYYLVNEGTDGVDSFCRGLLVAKCKNLVLNYVPLSCAALITFVTATNRLASKTDGNGNVDMS